MKHNGLRDLLHLRKKGLRLVLPGLAQPQPTHNSITAKVVGWSSLAVGVAALGVFVGREIRIRYKFRHRTPYDYYAHSADQTPADYGIGI